MDYIMKRWCYRSTTALSVAVMTVIVTATTLSLASNSFASGVMLQVTDCPLKEVISVLTQQSGCNIVIADDSKMEKKITLKLENVTLDNALNYVVQSAGISYRKMEDGTYIVGGANVVEPSVSLDDVKSSLPAVELTATQPAPVHEEGRVDVIKLVHSNATELMNAISGNSCNFMTAGDYLKKNPLTNFVDTPSGNTRPVTIVTHEGASYDPNALPGSLNNSMGVPNAGSGVNPGSGRTADSATGAGQVPSGPPGTPYGFGGSRTSSSSSTPNTTGSSSSSSNSKNMLWPEGVEEARPFDPDNSIIVKGNEEGIEKFKKIVRMLDVPPKQVSIKAEFVEVKTTDVKKFGIDWSLDRLNETFSTSFAPGGNVAFGFKAGNLTAQLQAQLTTDIGRVVNAPIISTINNQPATLQIQTIIPYWDSTTIITTTGSVAQSNVRYININTMLMVTPRVNGDGTITMMLMPQVADTGNVIAGPDGETIPEQRTQSLYTQRRVGNGETIVVGGFIRTNDSNSYQRIPILSSLPLVGSLFRTHSRSLEDRELLIFVTPTIIDDNRSGTVGDTMP